MRYFLLCMLLFLLLLLSKSFTHCASVTITMNYSHLRMMRFAEIENRFGQIENGGRKIVEQPKEHRVSPTIANFQVGQPNDRVARIFVRVLVEHVSEQTERHGIAFARRTMDQFGRRNWTGSRVPAHCDRGTDDVVAWNDVDD